MDITTVALELLFSFTCSIGFGIVFGIRPGELPLAGMCGVITRIVLIVCELFTDSRLIYVMIAAMIGSLFAEILGRRRNTAVTKFLYPSLVPLIPGDLLYKFILSIITLDHAGTADNALNLTQALFGIALGCMITPALISLTERFARRGKIESEAE